MDIRKTLKEIVGPADFRVVKLVFHLLLAVAASTFFFAFVTIWAGRALDKHFGTGPWFMVGLGILGLILTLGSVVSFSTVITAKMQRVLNEKKQGEVKIGRD